MENQRLYSDIADSRSGAGAGEEEKLLQHSTTSYVKYEEHHQNHQYQQQEELTATTGEEDAINCRKSLFERSFPQIVFIRGRKDHCCHIPLLGDFMFGNNRSLILVITALFLLFKSVIYDVSSAQSNILSYAVGIIGTPITWTLLGISTRGSHHGLAGLRQSACYAVFLLLIFAMVCFYQYTLVQPKYDGAENSANALDNLDPNRTVSADVTLPVSQAFLADGIMITFTYLLLLAAMIDCVRIAMSYFIGHTNPNLLSLEGEGRALDEWNHVQQLVRWRPSGWASFADDQKEKQDTYRIKNLYARWRLRLDHYITVPFFLIPQWRDYTIPAVEPGPPVWQPYLPSSFVVGQVLGIILSLYVGAFLYNEIFQLSVLIFVFINTIRALLAQSEKEPQPSNLDPRDILFPLVQIIFAVCALVFFLLTFFAIRKVRRFQRALQRGRDTRDPSVPPNALRYRPPGYGSVNDAAGAIAGIIVGQVASGAVTLFVASLVGIYIYVSFFTTTLSLKSQFAFLNINPYTIIASYLALFITRQLIASCLVDRILVHPTKGIRHPRVLSFVKLWLPLLAWASAITWTVKKIAMAPLFVVYSLLVPLSGPTDGDRFCSAMWSLLLLWHENTNPIKTCMVAIGLIDAEVRERVAAGEDLSSVPLSMMGEFIPHAHVRHMARLYICARVGVEKQSFLQKLSLAERGKEGLRLDLRVFAAELTRPLEQRRAAARWRLMMLLHRFPKLRDQRKYVLWATTLAAPPQAHSSVDEKSSAMTD